MYKQITAALLLSSLSFVTQADTSTVYKFDPNHTYIQWRASHFGFSSPSGKWLVNGTLNYDKNKIENSKVNAKIDVASLETGIPEFNKHLKAEKFLNVAKFPEASFTSTKILKTGENQYKIEGTLNLHGVSKPIVLDAKINKIGISPITEQQTIGISGKGQIKRSDFEMTSLIPDVGDEIHLEFEAEAVQPKGE